MTQSKETILVTGAAGFIGSRLVRKLLEAKKHVCVFVRPSSDLSRMKDVISSVHVIQGDLSDGARLAAQINEVKPSGIFHLAASNIASGVTESDEKLITTNIQGMVNLVRAVESIDYRFFIQAGTFLEYGAKGRPVRETEVCEPQELYSITKLAATLYGQGTARIRKKPIVSLRVFTPYGPGTQEKRFLYEVITRALKNEDIRATAPTTSRDFIYVDDLIALLLEASERAGEYGGEIFNAGGGRAVTFKEVIEYVLRATGSSST